MHLQVQIAERAREVTELKRNLAKAIRDKEQLQEVNKQIFFNGVKNESNLTEIFTHSFLHMKFR